MRTRAQVKESTAAVIFALLAACSPGMDDRAQEQAIGKKTARLHVKTCEGDRLCDDPDLECNFSGEICNLIDRGTLVSYHSFDEANWGTDRALDPGGNDGSFVGSAQRTVGLVGRGAAKLNGMSRDGIDVGSGDEYGWGDDYYYDLSSGITIEALFTTTWDGSTFAEIFRKEDGEQRILLSLQPGPHINDSYHQLAGSAGVPGISFGINVGGAYGELDIAFDGKNGRPARADVADGKTHYVVATYDAASGEKKVWLDARIIASVNLGANQALTSGGEVHAMIGATQVWNEPWNGVIDEVAVYSEALRAPEIGRHFRNIRRGRSYFDRVEPKTLSAGNGPQYLVIRPNGTVWKAPRMDLLTNVVAVKASWNHAVALRSNGDVIEWGSYAPFKVPGLPSDIVAISAGSYHSTAVTANGDLWDWPYKDLWAPPQKLTTGCTKTEAGWKESMCLKSDGSVYYKEIGGSVRDPVSGIDDAVDIAGGDMHGCALRSSGRVYCWGDSYGSPVPSWVQGLPSNLVAIAGGFYHDLALRADGTVWAWKPGDTPYQVPGVVNVTELAAGYNVNIARSQNGAIRKWTTGDTSIHDVSVDNQGWYYPNTVANLSVWAVAGLDGLQIEGIDLDSCLETARIGEYGIVNYSKTLPPVDASCRLYKPATTDLIGGVTPDSLWDLYVLADQQKSGPVSFATYGDMPYHVYSQEPGASSTEYDDEALKNRIAPAIQAKADLAFVLHLGDIGRPEGKGTDHPSSCDDLVRSSTKQFWNTDLKKQVFFTPGDNDWTDCNRTNVLSRLKDSPGAHLASVRANLLPSCSLISSSTASITCAPADVVNGIPFEFQRTSGLAGGAPNGDFPENQIWRVGSVLFVTVHMVGSCNGLSEGMSADDVEGRNSANQIWLQKAADRAQNDLTITALVVVSHTDVFENGNSCHASYPKSGYSGYIDALESVGESLKAKAKPVLFIHGDTAPHCLDQPFTSTNIWRLNGPGDFHAFDADVVTVDTSDPKKPFSVRALQSGVAVSGTCSAD